MAHRLQDRAKGQQREACGFEPDPPPSALPSVFVLLTHVTIKSAGQVVMAAVLLLQLVE